MTTTNTRSAVECLKAVADSSIGSVLGIVLPRCRLSSSSRSFVHRDLVPPVWTGPFCRTRKSLVNSKLMERTHEHGRVGAAE